VKGRLLLNVVVGQSPSIFQLLSGKNETLLIWRNALFILNFGLDIFNGVWRFYLEGDGFTSQCLHEDLHTSSQSQDQVKGGLLLNVVVRQSSSIFQLLTSKNQTLLIWGNALFILDFSLDVFNGVWGFYLEGDGFASQCLHEDLHTSSQSQDQVKGGLLLNVVVRQSSSIFQLLTSKNQTLLIWGNAFLVLDLGLDILNGVGGFNLKGDGLASQSFNKDLHTSPQSQNQVKSWLLLDVVVRQSSSIFQLLTSKNQTLLIWGNAFLVLDLGLDILNGVGGFDLEGDGLAGQGFHKDLHTSP